MKSLSRFILYLASAIGVWLLVSFGGAMIDSARAALWSDSLMWALLSFLVIMPALVMAQLASDQAAQSRQRTARAQSASSQSASSQTASTDAAEQEPFVDKGSKEVNTLWPEPEQDTEWPAQHTSQERDRAHA
jgi:hypothetical protein